ncbi:MAG TPA: hypothetical protein VFX38_06820 [Gammaproteobacteria bacterium]|nr:hypothetical protein [Gammaproteobacteria bacterium]
MKFRNGLGLTLFAMSLSATAGAGVPMPTDMPEYIVTAMSPDSSEIVLPAPVPPAPLAAQPIIDNAAVLKELRAEQAQAAMAVLAKVAGEEVGN